MANLLVNRTKRIASGLYANSVTQSAQLVIRLLEIPILLSLWGVDRYGQWLMVAALPTAIAFSDGGFTKTARRQMAMQAGNGNYEGVRATFQSTFVLLLASAIFVLLLLAVILPYLPLVELLGLNTLTSTSLTISLLALAAQVLLFLQCGLLHGGLTSRGHYAAGELCISASLGLVFIGTVAGAAVTGSIVGASIGSLLGQILGFGLMLRVFIKNKTSIRYGFSCASRREIRALWGPSMANLAFPIGDALSLQGVRIVVGVTLGPAQLALFSTLRTLCRSAMQPVLAIARTVEPEMSIAHGSGASNSAKEMFVAASHASFWLSVLLCISVALVGPYLFTFWSRSHLQLDSVSMLVLLAASLLSVIWGVSLTVLTSQNKHSPVALPFLFLYGIGSLLTVWVLSYLMRGPTGAAVGLLCGELMAAVLITRAALRSADLTAREWGREVLKSPLPLAAQLTYRFRNG